MVYGVVTTLVNLTNSYDKQEVIPEMVELAKFAKQHIPEEHELDDEDFVIKRQEVRLLYTWDPRHSPTIDARGTECFYTST